MSKEEIAAQVKVIAITEQGKNPDEPLSQIQVALLTATSK